MYACAGQLRNSTVCGSSLRQTALPEESWKQGVFHHWQMEFTKQDKSIASPRLDRMGQEIP